MSDSVRFHSSRPTVGAPRRVVVSIRPSLLRLGLPARLAGASILLAGVWAMIGWTLR